MSENKINSPNDIVIGRASAGYALTMFRNNVSESELDGYLMNTKKDVSGEMVVCMFLWLRSIAKTLPEKTLNAWGGQGCPRKPFFNWFFGNLKRKAEFQTFAFDWLKKQQAEQAAIAAASSYGDGVDFGGFSDLAEYNTSDIVNDFESWVAAGGCIPAGDETRGAGLASDAPVPGCYDLDGVDF